jgi:hypothetical protein
MKQENDDARTSSPQGVRAFRRLGLCVTVFGSARFGPEDLQYAMARQVAAGLAEAEVSRS